MPFVTTMAVCDNLTWIAFSKNRKGDAMNYASPVSTSARLNYSFDKANVHEVIPVFSISLGMLLVFFPNPAKCMYHTYRYGGEPFSELSRRWKYVDAIPFSLASCLTTPIILCQCLKRTNVYCYFKAAFVVIACALCPLLLVSALLSFCAGLEGIGAAHRLCSSLIRKGGRKAGREGECFSAGLCFIFIKRAAFDLLPLLWRVTSWAAAPHCSLTSPTTPWKHIHTITLHPQTFPPSLLPAIQQPCPPTPHPHQSDTMVV